MKKRVQSWLTEEAWSLVQSVTKEANEHFDVGSISISDTINEMVLTSRVDIRNLQLKHADLRKSLRSLVAKENLDVEMVLKVVSELKNKSAKKPSKTTGASEENT